jgi:hypothetical protein
MPDASPVKWHLAHTTWFFETFILAERADFQPFDPAFRVLFNSYYVGVGDRHPRPERGLLSRPDLATVRAYRAHVDAAMHALLALDLDRETAGRIELGLHHEQQHQELILTDLKHLFSRNPAAPVYRAGWPLAPVRPRRAEWIGYRRRARSVRPRGDGFAFDNELPRPSRLPRAVLARVAAGDARRVRGVRRRRRATAGPSCGCRPAGTSSPRAGGPRRCTGSATARRGRRSRCTGRVEIDAHTPMCHLSFFEADAYARWAGRAAADRVRVGARRARRAGRGQPARARRAAPDAARRRHAARHARRSCTATCGSGRVATTARIPGYAPAKARSASTTASSWSGSTCCAAARARRRARTSAPTYRNFFAPDARWQFSGVRLAATRA